jgi:HlyD family secretion protein
MRGVTWAANLLLGGFVIGLGIWSFLAPLESAAIAAGTVEVESSRKTIQHLEGGIVGAILVRDGEHVSAGQTVVRLDDTTARTQLKALLGQYWDAQAREDRLTAERDRRDRIAFRSALQSIQHSNPSVDPILRSHEQIFETGRRVKQTQISVAMQQMAQTENEIVGLRAQQEAAASRAAIIRKEVGTVVPLVEKGLERRPRLLALEREMAEIDGRRGEIAAQISRAQRVISEAQVSLFKIEVDRQNAIVHSLRETQNEILQLSARIQAGEDLLSRTEVKAPEDGIVTELRIHTPGGVIGAGAPIMDLVPRQDRLVISARVRPEDIDVVHQGLSAKVHLLAYKQRLVAALDGVVSYVSPDRLVDRRTDQPYYAAKIKVDDKRLTELDEVQMIPGMPVQVMIKTGESTAALYFLKPFLDSINRAFRED